MDGEIVNSRMECLAGEPVNTELAAGRFSVWFTHTLVVAGIAAVLYYNFRIIIPRFEELISEHHTFRLFFYPSLLWMMMGCVLLIFRAIVWFHYRPFAAATKEDAPSITVVIPAYNEGKMVHRAISSAAEADYPRHKLEIIVIDDGSRDDTWEHICAAAARYPGLVFPLKQDRNYGKRLALARGFERARGDLIVSLDSDSVIDPGSLLAIAGPFRDKCVGAVAGKVAVYNRKGFIPRMLHARYMLSFDLLRAVESAYGNVFCCPGALTALRVSAIRPIIARWKAQTFLGSTCTIGEDRAMTNYLLEAGYNTVYQGSAVVRTIVPHDFKKLCKMLLRWDRSYIREELRFARIVWSRPWKTRLIAGFDRFVTNLRYPVYYSSLFMLPPMMMHDPWTIMRLLTAIGVISLCNMIYFVRSEKSFEFLWGVVYSYFAVFTLSWIFPYAVMTMRKRGWLTR